MRPFSILLLIFLVVPVAEIYLLFQVGGLIGAGWTIFMVVFTALLGAVLVRAQGFSAVRRIQAQLAAGELPALELLEGVVLLVAGALLLTPGFFTDAVGFACLTPPLRRGVIRLALEKNLITGHHPDPDTPPRRGDTLEGEFRHLDE